MCPHVLYVNGRNPSVRRVLHFVTQRLSQATDVSDALHPQRPSRDRRGPVRTGTALSCDRRARWLLDRCGLASVAPQLTPLPLCVADKR
jgi:hypothetical protein